MARSRTVKPGFFENEDLAECSMTSRLLFIGLWTLADRRGIVEDRPRRISGALFRYEQIDCEPLLDELAQRGFIKRYEVNGVRCIHVVKFEKHQNPHQNEKNSELPDAPTEGAPTNSGASTRVVPEHSQSDPADYLLPITDSPITDHPSPEKESSADADQKQPRAKPERDPELPPQPWDILEAVCEEIGSDPTELTKQDKNRQLGTAKRLVENQVSVSEIRQITRWLTAQSWVSAVDLQLIEKQISKWRMNGKPVGPPGQVRLPDGATWAEVEEARTKANSIWASSMSDKERRLLEIVDGRAAA